MLVRSPDLQDDEFLRRVVFVHLTHSILVAVFLDLLLGKVHVEVALARDRFQRGVHFAPSDLARHWPYIWCTICHLPVPVAQAPALCYNLG